MPTVDYVAPEYRADDTFAMTEFRIAGDPERGWTVWRRGERHLELGAGYRLLRTEACGVCSTDLDRRFLPFPLPQVTGHELVARDETGQRFVVEINASPFARGLATDCPDCADGLDRHCPKRLVLGIHDLPGGFGSWVLAPVGAAIPVPDVVPNDAAVLIEPFAAALRAVERVRPADGDVIAVLGPRKLGMLVLAALGAYRRRTGRRFETVAMVRRSELAAVALAVGADRVEPVGGDASAAGDRCADVVIDTTGSSVGFELALRSARREVHLKSTHGRPAGGLRHATALVVDELSIERFDPERAFRDVRSVAWLADAPAPTAADVVIHRGRAARSLRDRLEPRPGGCIAGVDVAVVDDLTAADAVIRPSIDDELSLVRPCGRIALRGDPRDAGSPLELAIVRDGLRLTSSRCGDFRRALRWMADDAELRTLGDRLITHRFATADIAEAFATARAPECLKAVLTVSDTG